MCLGPEHQLPVLRFRHRKNSDCRLATSLAASPDRQLGSRPLWLPGLEGPVDWLKGITGNYLPRRTRGYSNSQGRERNLVGFPLRLEPQRREGPVLPATRSLDDLVGAPGWGGE